MSSPELPEERISRLAAAATAEVSKDPDPNTLREKEDLHERYGVQTGGQKQDIDERKKYALCFFVLSCGWLTLITLILLLQGFGSFAFFKRPFKLDTSVVLAVIGSTTANVLWILYIVAKYLFPNPGNDDGPPPNP
jgi:multidrug efflux pump subunit AcrB